LRRYSYIRTGDAAVEATVATILMVVITVALASVLGVFIFGLVHMPEEAPVYETFYTSYGGRYTFHIKSADDPRPLREFQVVCYDGNGSMKRYDSDGDMVLDKLLAIDLDKIAVTSAASARTIPIAYLDIDGDGEISSGDTLIAYSTYMPAVGLLSDGDRGYRAVGLPPDDIPLDSDLVLHLTPATLGYAGINPGDTVQVELKHGSHVEATVTGAFAEDMTYTMTVHMDASWFQGNYKAVVSVRPGEPTEWANDFQFKAKAPEPITPEERATYDSAFHAFGKGDHIALVHKPSHEVSAVFDL
jgi:hypothetical protein